LEEVVRAEERRRKEKHARKAQKEPPLANSLQDSAAKDGTISSSEGVPY